MNLIAYCRVSTIEQADTGYSLDAQEHLIQDYAQRNNHTISKVFKEQASGAATVRPILDQALDALNQADGLIIIRLDRLVRSVQQFCNYIELLEREDKSLISIGDNLDMSSPAGRMMAHVLAAVGQYEREMIVQRTREGLAQRKRNGLPLGRPPQPLPTTTKRTIIRNYQTGMSLKDNAESTNVSIGMVRRVLRYNQ